VSTPHGAKSHLHPPPGLLKPGSGSGRSPGLTDKTPTVLAQEQATPVLPEPHAKERSL